MSFENLGPEYADLPEWFIPALEAYLDYGELDEPFLTALLENDLKGVISHADDTALTHLRTMFRLVYNHIPGNVWGSYEKVVAHCAGGP